VTVRRVEAPDGFQWAAQLEHPQWGSARLEAPRVTIGPPPSLMALDPSLTPDERAELEVRAESSLFLKVPPREENVLRDRKRLLRFLGAVMGEDGAGVLDVTAGLVWSRDRLAEELRHDAPLDIMQMVLLHLVQCEGGEVWLHSHGLGEMGFVDFDVLRPAPALTEDQYAVLRAIAFAIVEGPEDGHIDPVIGADPIALVDANDFMRGARDADRRMREPEDHSERRVVCCDARPPGWLPRLFGAGSWRPSRILSRGMDPKAHLVRFSSEATELCAQRARETLPTFDGLRLEFADLDCEAMVKLAYETDANDGGQEHLWFEVQAIAANGIHAVLINDPFDIADMHAGMRVAAEPERLSDWTLFSPVGEITPRSLERARLLREVRPEIQDALEREAEPA
jgi:uncharacterized protein YegJ (DUF2314 family)